jgi:hypothetical protein
MSSQRFALPGGRKERDERDNCGRQVEPADAGGADDGEDGESNGGRDGCTIPCTPREQER